MQNLTHDLFYGSLLLSAAATVVYLILVTRFISRLQAFHREVFEELGEPSLFSNNTPEKALRLVKYVLRGDFKRLSDRTARSLGSASRLLLIVILFCYLLCMSMLVLHWGPS